MKISNNEQNYNEYNKINKEEDKKLDIIKETNNNLLASKKDIETIMKEIQLRKDDIYNNMKNSENIKNSMTGNIMNIKI